MLIWAILLASFIGGIAVLAKGSLKISERRQIVGDKARLVGVSMVLLPFAVLGTTFGVMAASQAYGSARETALTHGMIAGAMLVSVAAITLAANAKRWSVPVQARSSGPDFSGVTSKPTEPDFNFLDRSDDQ